MTFSVHIVHNYYGVTRDMPQSTEDWDEMEFMWTEGNYACDCNRSLFFHRAAGEPDDDEQHCGNEMFAIYVTSPDGAVLYDERREP